MFVVSLVCWTAQQLYFIVKAIPKLWYSIPRTLINDAIPSLRIILPYNLSPVSAGVVPCHMWKGEQFISSFTWPET